ncbi:MAG: DUF4124 domain-containing protein [Proteobacteria bacterium]|nr:DUF4124 domain-containing protein [Pseudomonadota bacterium]
MSLRIALVLAALLCSPLVRADIFKCVDEAGHVTYTNSKTSARGCSVLARDQAVSSVPSGGGRPAAQSASVGSASSGSAGFPRVDAGTQKARDTDRRRILEEELGAEQSALDVASRQLAEQDSARRGGDRQPLKDKIQLHERNIEALKREISNLR